MSQHSIIVPYEFLSFEVDFDYYPASRGAREKGSGVQLEPDEPESWEVTEVRMYNPDDMEAEVVDVTDQLNEKMLLFTEYPPDARGAAFMRWGYQSASGKKAQHWIYLPELKKIRRISVRDQADRFLGSELTYADITPRAVEEDSHQFVGRHRKGKDNYVLVASMPKDKSYLYSKRVHWFKLGRTWHDCVVSRTDYYDHKGQLLKKQYYNWQNVKGVWVWREVLVENVQTYRSSLFTVENATVNTGLRDEYFAERTLRSSQISASPDRHRFALH